MFACVFSELGGLCGWERYSPAAVPGGSRGQLALHRYTKHRAAAVISRQVLAKSGLGRFPRGWPRPLNGQHGCSPAGFHAVFCKSWTCHEDKHWAIVPKVCHPFMSFAQRTLEEEDGREKVKDLYGFKLAEDIPSPGVNCGMTEAIYRHTGFNPVAFTPASRAICSALDCLRSPPGAGGQGSGERTPSLAGGAGEASWDTRASQVALG